MPRGRPTSQPSRRNLEIYHELICHGLPQSVVAIRFRCTQPRISQIRRQIELWVAAQLPVGWDQQAQRTPAHQSHANWPPAAHRFHLAIALCRQQLSSAYTKYLSHFGGTRGASAYRHLLVAIDAGIVPPEITGSLPPRRFLLLAVRMSRELNDLARVARRGPYFQLQGAPRLPHAHKDISPEPA